ncbi:hypothetical protein BT96DRAFT_989361 [Gymnopus androsaceus JB14]|uniref:Uncharacterized protein n=1 Tax=Gymnopus androsaceus JB14 TaxID=1447944 RepID=A0A6A4HYR2_9AGAR|nr:hypothetical protein BT96DRAFT_989361 [Gymnopus androsaceus JB14]
MVLRRVDPQGQEHFDADFEPTFNPGFDPNFNDSTTIDPPPHSTPQNGARCDPPELIPIPKDVERPQIAPAKADQNVEPGPTWRLGLG